MFQFLDLDAITLTQENTRLLHKDKKLHEVVQRLYTRGIWDAPKVLRLRQEQHANYEGVGRMVVDQAGQVCGWYGIFPYAGELSDYEATAYLTSHLWGEGLFSQMMQDVIIWSETWGSVCLSVHEDNARSLAACKKIFGNFTLIDEPFRKRKSWVHVIGQDS